MGSQTQTEGGSVNVNEQNHPFRQLQRVTMASINNRRMGSSWNRGSSAWNVGGKEFVRGRRRGTTDVNNNSRENNETARSSKSSEVAQAEDPIVAIEVRKEDGAFRVEGSVDTVVDPDTLYGIITNYDSNARVFRNVDRVEVVEQGGDKVVTQFLHWNFLMWSGQYDVKLRMKDDPKNRSISYELEQPGFLKVFKGSWTVEPLQSDTQECSSKLVLNQRTLPSFLPPGPLAVGSGSYVTKIIQSQVKNILTDLAAEAVEIKKSTPTSA